jgi:hypothetical protein
MTDLGVPQSGIQRDHDRRIDVRRLGRTSFPQYVLLFLGGQSTSDVLALVQLQLFVLFKLFPDGLSETAHNPKQDADFFIEHHESNR